MVLELHTMMLKLNSLLAHLPALALQLVEQLGLHSSAANFGTWLRAAEEALQWSESSLVRVEKALLRIKDGWKEKIKVVHQKCKTR
jgi:hypothetical protein